MRRKEGLCRHRPDRFDKGCRSPEESRGPEPGREFVRMSQGLLSEARVWKTFPLSGRGHHEAREEASRIRQLLPRSCAGGVEEEGVDFHPGPVPGASRTR